MATITVKNIPEELYRRLKESAAQHHRSLNGEIIARLEASLTPPRPTVEETLARLRDLRERYPVRTTRRAIDTAKKEGRP
jgi:plasmid stability protein